MQKWQQAQVTGILVTWGELIDILTAVFGYRIKITNTDATYKGSPMSIKLIHDDGWVFVNDTDDNDIDLEKLITEFRIATCLKGHLEDEEVAKGLVVRLQWAFDKILESFPSADYYTIE